MSGVTAPEIIIEVFFATAVLGRPEISRIPGNDPPVQEKEVIIQ
jgi:hypothetical protein